MKMRLNLNVWEPPVVRKKRFTCEKFYNKVKLNSTLLLVSIVIVWSRGWCCCRLLGVSRMLVVLPLQLILPGEAIPLVLMLLPLLLLSHFNFRR